MPEKKKVACFVAYCSFNDETNRGVCIGVTNKAPPDAHSDDLVHFCIIKSKTKVGKGCAPIDMRSMTPIEAVKFGVELIRASVYAHHVIWERKEKQSP